MDEEMDDGYGSNEQARYQEGFRMSLGGESCPCHGSGWALSNLDVWEQCREHYTDQPHPESDEERPTDQEQKDACGFLELGRNDELTLDNHTELGFNDGLTVDEEIPF